MKNFGLAFLIFLIWTTFGLWLYSWITPIDTIAATAVSTEILETNPVTTTNIETAIIPEELIDSISIIEEKTPIITGLTARTVDSDLIFNFKDGFSFKKDSVGFIIPESITDYKYKLNSYLAEKPSLELHILSTYSPAERLENPNMGEQRGQLIVDELTALGIDENLLVVQPIIDDIDFDEEAIFENAISFQFKPLDQNRLETIASQVVEIPENITFYPRFSDTGILKSDKLDDLLVSVKEVMDSDPMIRLKIIGHTDNLSNTNLNYKIGLKYAQEMRWYFKAKGNINPNRISAISRGEVRPIRTNKTESGRRANRRVELQFIK